MPRGDPAGLRGALMEGAFAGLVVANRQVTVTSQRAEALMNTASGTPVLASTMPLCTVTEVCACVRACAARMCVRACGGRPAAHARTCRARRSPARWMARHGVMQPGIHSLGGQINSDFTQETCHDEPTCVPCARGRASHSARVHHARMSTRYTRALQGHAPYGVRRHGGAQIRGAAQDGPQQLRVHAQRLGLHRGQGKRSSSSFPPSLRS